MKNELKSANPNKFDILFSLKLSRNEILSFNAMNKIKGGDGEGNGGADIIIIPKPK